VGLHRGSSPRRARKGTSAPRTPARPRAANPPGPGRARESRRDAGHCRPDQGDPELEERGDRRTRAPAAQLVEVLRPPTTDRPEPRVHPGGDEVGAVDEGDPRARCLHAARERDVLEDLAGHPAVTAGGLVDVAGGQDEDPVGGGERRRGVVHPRQREPLVEQAKDDRLDHALPERAGQLAARQRQQRDAVRFRESQGVRDRPGRVDRVGVGEAQPAPAGGGHAGVEREALPGPSRRRAFDAEDPQTRVPPGEIGKDGRCPVGRGVIDGDDLAVSIRLRQQRREACLHAPLLVAHRNEDADKPRAT
jgi:hypothetical protein